MGKSEEVTNFNPVKKQLGCRPFIYFLYRFRKVYIEGGVIATSIFHIKDKESGLCLVRGGPGVMAQECDKNKRNQMYQKGNVDKKTGTCCSGVRSYGSNDCWDFMDDHGIHWYSHLSLRQEPEGRKDAVRKSQGRPGCL